MVAIRKDVAFHIQVNRLEFLGNFCFDKAYLVVCCSQSVNNGSWVGLVCVFHFLGRSRTHLGAL